MTDTDHPYWPVFLAAVERGSYDLGQFAEFCGYMSSKSEAGRGAEIEDAEARL